MSMAYHCVKRSIAKEHLRNRKQTKPLDNKAQVGQHMLTVWLTKLSKVYLKYENIKTTFTEIKLKKAF
jgi:hypothetical protein